jgi:hypothetical protein
MLGHVEFDPDRGRFAAAPTTLTSIPRLPGLLLLTGARGRGLIAELAALAASGPWDVEVVSDLRHQFGRAPSTAFIEADPTDAPEFCAEAGIAWGPAAAHRISALLPEFRLETATIAYHPDNRFPHALIDPYMLRPRWDHPGRDGEAGLWLYRTWGRRREMVICDGEHDPRLVLDAESAPYLMARPDDADPIVEYRRAHNLLIVNAAAPLPALHARVACLCSGRAPIRHDVAPGIAYDHFVNVDSRTARSVLRSLVGESVA